MKFYQVIDKDLAEEVKYQLEKLAGIQNKFLQVSFDYGFSGAFIDKPSMLDELGNVYCRGFAQEVGSLTNEQKTKFKLTSKGRIAIPRKAYEAEVKNALGGLEFNSIYNMSQTWKKFVIKQSYASAVGNFIIHEGVHGSQINGKNVYLAITAEREQAKLNTEALKEIKESDYLAIQGK